MALGTGGLWNRLPMVEDRSLGPIRTPVTSLVRVAERVNYRVSWSEFTNPGRPYKTAKMSSGIRPMPFQPSEVP